MLTIVTDKGIISGVIRLFIRGDARDAAFYVWFNEPTALNDYSYDGKMITPPMTAEKAKALYNKIAKDVLLGTKVIDLRDLDD